MLTEQIFSDVVIFTGLKHILGPILPLFITVSVNMNILIL